MNSWVYLFSRFTPEALLLEALVICALTAWYAAYWVLRKRRLGVIETAVPASVVKHHLNELIAEAERLRAQLFGLLTSGSTPAEMAQLQAAMASLAPAAANVEIRPAPGIPEAMAAQVSAADSALTEKITALEQKISEQTRVIHTINLEKGKLEQRLAAAASSAPAGSDSAGGHDAELLEKVRNLEAKLAEYSVIEDDLANLKRLQQENAQLKTALAAKASAAVAAPSIAAAEATAPGEADNKPQLPADTETATAELETNDEALGDSMTVETQPEVAASAPAAAPATPSPAAAATAPAAPSPAAKSSAAKTDQFEDLVNEVEKSLQDGQEKSVQSETLVGALPSGQHEESDEDLVAEFEKMING